MSSYAAMLDFDWFEQHVRDEILPRWLGAVTDEGLYLPHFDRAWQPLAKNYGTLVSQCRLLYNFSQGYALTHEQRYLDAVQKGAQFLLTHFRDTKQGGWYWSCNLAGEVLDTHKDSYGHTFAIFGLSHAYACTGDPALQAAFLHTWDVFAHARPRCTRRLSLANVPRLHAHRRYALPKPDHAPVRGAIGRRYCRRRDRSACRGEACQRLCAEQPGARR